MVQRLSVSRYESPLGDIMLVSNGMNLVGACFKGQLNESKVLQGDLVQGDEHAICAAKSWLDLYFDGKNPNLKDVSLLVQGTEYQMQVWKAVLSIGYGKTSNYLDVGKEVSQANGKGMHLRAVGSAIGRNPLIIFVPCHRVVGKNGSLAGYSAGLDIKLSLLQLENPDFKILA
jgi:methylated-DNA-[protein]-cysteine S-methyltransferase